MTYLEKLEKLHPDIVANFLLTGETSAIPEELQLFIQQMQYAAEVYDKERNITRAARLLRQRIAASQHIDVDERTCKARIYSAIEYFAVDVTVKQQIWETDYANKFEDLAKLAVVRKDLKTAKACFQSAKDCRVAAAAAATTDLSNAPVFILSPNISLEELGFEKKSLKEIAAKHERGVYLDLIMQLPTGKDEKKRLLNDAGITDVEFEEKAYGADE